jgi:FMN-dependent oxidoreductase (nitrilotriacetate monooxygenase family)
MSPRQMTLFTFLRDTGSHLAGWRHPDAYDGGLHRFGYYKALAQTAERGKLDAIFLADTVGFRHVAGRDAYSRLDVCHLEPATLLSALSQATSRIGLVGTLSTTFMEPYTIARLMASLDHISEGRAGWNVVTSVGENEAHNYGLVEQLDHDLRYARADEFVGVVKDLWDSWEDEAWLIDKTSGRYFDPDKVHALNHRGEYLSVAGPLNIRRPRQGHPVIVQAGSSGTGRRFAARHAEAIFTIPTTMEAAQAFRADVHAQATGFARAVLPRVLPAIHAVIAPSEAEARARYAALSELVDPVLSVGVLQMLLGGVDLSGAPLDGPLPDDIPPTVTNATTRQGLIDLGQREGLTIRQLAVRAAVGRGALMLAGTAEQVADHMQAWFEQGAADGFMLSQPYLPGGLEDFVDQVIPILQARGLFRREYEGETLRDHIGLPRPPNRFVAEPSRHAEPEMWGPMRDTGGPTRS